MNLENEKKTHQKKLIKKQQQANKMKRKREATVISKSSLGSIHYLNDLLSGGPLV